MPPYDIPFSVFDPVRFTTSTASDRFIVDTWFRKGLITQELYTRLPGVPIVTTGLVEMSSGMAMRRPLVEVGVQINNIRALPLSVFVVDDGPAPLLLGADFLELLFRIGVDRRMDGPTATLEPPKKRGESALAIRLVAENDNVELRELERFTSGLRRIYNCAVIAEHRSSDLSESLPDDEAGRIATSLERVIREDSELSREEQLRIGWIESESPIWMTVVSGSGKALSWLVHLFDESIDAKIERSRAAAAKATEEATVQELTRQEIVRQRRAEANLKTAAAVTQARQVWRKEVLGDLDFRQALEKRIRNPKVRKKVQDELEEAMAELATAKIYPMLEHAPRGEGAVTAIVAKAVLTEKGQ
jgi:hypothetical protein